MDLLTEMVCVESARDTITISLRGRLDTAGVDAVETKFAASAKHKNILVDLSQVTFLASMGIRMLIASARNLGKSGSKMVLVGPQELVAETLQSAGIDQIIEVAANEAAALEKLPA